MANLSATASVSERGSPAPISAEVALQARSITKHFRGGVRALDGLDLDIPIGSICALVGPNGAGKSTLMKAWVGFERPSTGAVAVFGIDPWQDKPAALDRIGYVSQKPALYRGLTVADHVALAGSLRSGFDPVLAEGRLDELEIPLRQDARTLSGGQQAQVMLALALGTHARVFILDEPLASLDPLARREFLHVLVDAVRTDRATAILSSHVITDVEQACDRIVVLGGGRKVLDASITAAVAGHRVATAGALPDTNAGSPVATFLDSAGRPVTLWQVAADGPADPTLRPATLEEVVLGQLAASRPQRATSQGLT